jgi:hypothetical protein
MTTSKTSTGQGQGADRPLKGEETFDLYLAEMGRSVVALGEQSVLLLKAVGERVALLPAIEAEQIRQAQSASEPAEVEPLGKEPGGAARQAQDRALGRIQKP